MNKKIIILTLAFILMGAGVYFQNNKNKSTENKKEFLSEKILRNTDKIEIISNKDSVILKLSDKKWRVENKFQWNADFSEIKNLVDELKNIKNIHDFLPEKDSKKRLSLLNPIENKNENAGIIVNLKDKEDKILFSLTAGKKREKGGRYMMFSGSEKIFLTENNFLLNTEKKQWLDKNLLNIKSENIKKISLYNNKNKKIYELQRDSKSKEILLDNEKNTVNKNSVKNIFSSLEDLEFQNLEKKQNKDFKYKLIFQTKKDSLIEILISKNHEKSNLISLNFINQSNDDKIGVAENTKGLSFEIAKWNFENFILDKTKLLKSKSE